nr:reverse transcriptase domain-containing protein [Tanacetum cinerariifolium]
GLEEFVSQDFAVNHNQGNTSYRPPMMSNQIRHPEKLGDPDKFLIPSYFSGMDVCLALVDLDARINLMSFSVWKILSLPELTPTYFDSDPRVPLILERSFLMIGRALIDVFEGELTLREVLGFFDMIASGNPTPYYDPIVSTTSLTLTPFRNSNFLLEDDPTSSKVDQSYLDSEGDILLLESFLNDDSSLPSPNQGNYLPEVRKELKICEAKYDKSSIDEPPKVELTDLPPHLEYAFLEGDDKFPVIIAKDLSMKEKTALRTSLKSHNPWDSPVHCVPKKGGFIVTENEENELIPTRMVTGWRVCIDYHQEKTTFTCPYGTFAYRCMPFGLCNAPGTFQRCMMAIFHDMIEKTMEVFMDDFSAFENSFQSCLFYLEKMLKMCEDTNLCLNSRRVTLWLKRLTEAPILIAPDWDMPFELMCDASNFAIGAKNLAADHVSQLENPHQNVLDPKEINESFPLETLHLVSTRGNSSTPWFADFANYHAGNFIVKGMSSQQKTYKTPISCTPYKLVYGKVCHLPIELKHKANLALKHANSDLQTTGNHIKVQLNELNELRDQAYENSLIYKEKTKRLHDSKIKDRVFNISDRVLLFNSRLNIFSCKLKSRWSGPFTISHVFSYGTIELSQPDEPNFKVNGHRVKHYFGEDVPKMVVPNL